MQNSRALRPTLPSDDVRVVAPALEKYTRGTLLDNLWKRPDLGPRDRSIITISALVARDQTIEMPYYLNLALDNGVKPSEISEIITHLAFYSGWSNAMSAVAIAKDIFAQRGIGVDQLPPASPELLPIDQSAEAQRAPVSSNRLARSLQGSCSSPRMFCSVICGCVRDSRHAIGASSLSAH